MMTLYRIDYSKLVDVDRFADVTFTFPSRNAGDGGTPNSIKSVKAHKVFLITVSPVFHTMFCGSLPPPTNEVTIKDICREDFLEVLRHIYGSDASINFENVFGIWYAAQKYLIAELIKKCVDFVLTKIIGSNVLDVFNSVQLFDNHQVDKKCLKIILDYPDQYIEANGIVKMNKDAFRKFIQKFKINCSSEFLKAIALKWLNCQKRTEYCCFSDKVKLILQKEFNIQPMHFEQKEIDFDLDVNYFDSTLFQNMELDSVEVNFGDKTCELHGIGIYVGIDPDDTVPAGSSEWVVVTVSRGQGFHMIC